ncbi:MAG: PAS domain S-box protein [Gammaproteobacteria bacterium]|nr:PAS domain S-box protein [Gammaproteobacteria bacterium]MCP5418691.1 PAS domain S-box protein [Chromatiaceae bacterium]
MTLLSILIGLACGALVWAVLDQVQPKALRSIFDEELQTRLEQQARETLIRFENYVAAHTSTTRLLANHRSLSSYLDPIYWSDLEESDPTVYFSPPPWLPATSLWRSLVEPGKILLIDRQGRTREVYNLDLRLLPPELLKVDRRFLTESRVQAFLTTLEGRPYLLISEVAEDGTGTNMGYLMMVVPLDSEFLLASQQGVSSSGVLVGLFDADEQRFLSSSDSRVVPAGSRIEQVSRNFVVTAQSFFQYEGSVLNMQFATLVPRSALEETQQRVEGVERRQRLVAATTFISVFTLVFYLLSERLNRILRRISLFSRRALGRRQPAIERGNQIYLLEDWIKQFIGNVLTAREEMRREHETELKQSEAIKQAILEAALDPIITIDRKGKIIEFNSTAEKEFGYRRDDVIGILFPSLIIRAEDNPKFNRMLKRLETDASLERGEIRGEMSALRADTTQFPVEVAIKPIQLPLKEVFTIYVRDITSRRRAEEMIVSLAKFPTESPSPILRVNRPGVIIYANPASAPLLAYWECAQGQKLPLYWRNRVVNAFNSGSDWESEVIVGEHIYSLLVTPVVELNYVNIYGRDITEVRRAEIEARQHQQELVHVSRLSTMGEMATGLAHELNQPLSAIANYASGCVRRLPAEMEGADDLKFALGQISGQAERAGEIIRRLRRLVGKQLPVRSEADMNNLIREVCTFVEFEARKTGVIVEQELTAGRLPVRVDVVQIEQVLLNLIRNALEALQEVPEKRRSLVVRSGYQESGEVRVDVVDTGSGIKKEAARNLFTPFFTTKASGMGMGLVISQTIAKDHGGKIEVDPTVSVGSHFCLTLPAYENLEDKQ